MKQELAVKTRRSILRGRNGGQALVEYILIVCIAIGLLFMMKNAFSSMNTFINNYIGLYTECLMAHGELPALGVTDSDMKKHLSEGFICNSGFKPFTLAEGRPPIASGNASGNSSNGGGKNSGKNNVDSSSSGGSDRSSSKDSRGDRDNASFGGKGSGSSPYTEGSVRRGRSSADGFASAGSDRQRVIDDEGEGDEEGGRGRKRKPRESRIIYRDRPRYRAILGDEAEQLVKQSERSTNKRKVTSRSIAKVEGGGLSGPRSGLMKPPPEKKTILVEEQSEGWGAGKLLKWLLIICMIIALVIFFGGQLLNYSNSDSS